MIRAAWSATAAINHCNKSSRNEQLLCFFKTKVDLTVFIWLLKRVYLILEGIPLILQSHLERAIMMWSTLASTVVGVTMASVICGRHVVRQPFTSPLDALRPSTNSPDINRSAKQFAWKCAY